MVYTLEGRRSQIQGRTNLLGDFGVLITTLDHGIFPLDMLFFHDGGFDERFNE
jgi:hypothetical protein